LKFKIAGALALENWLFLGLILGAKVGKKMGLVAFLARRHCGRLCPLGYDLTAPSLRA
jgi:hypothetical protein